MSKIQILYLFTMFIQTHCARMGLEKSSDDDGDLYYRYNIYSVEDKSTTSIIGDVSESTELTKALTKTKNTKTISVLPTGRPDIIARIQEQLARKSAPGVKPEFKIKKGVPYSRNFSLGMNVVLPARRTDVIAQLQDQRARHGGAKAYQPNDINYELPGEIWPAITFRIPKVMTPFTLPTPPSKPTRTFRDHFQSVRLDFRPKHIANLDFLTSKKSSDTGAGPLDIATFSKYMWKHNFLTTAQPTWYAVYRTIPCTSKLPGRTNNDFTGILTKSSLFKTTLKGTDKNTSAKSTLLETGEIDYLHDDYEEDLKRYYEQFDDLRKENVMLAVPPVGLYNINRSGNNTTTTTRTTRTYPQPKWICYECGRNETTFGSSFCSDVFDTQNGHLHGKQRSLRYRCNGNESVAYQCFKRFVDVGDYNERGCRDWPPRRSGKTYASKRLRALEKMLKHTNDGCVFTPQAYLLSFSRTVQIYVRFHACVCNGTLCNGVSAISVKPWLISLVSVTGTILLQNKLLVIFCL